MADLLAHWPFLTAALIFAAAGQVAKGAVFTREAIRARMPGWQGHALWWGRKTLALHPVAVGALVGLIPGIPTSPGVPGTLAASCLYFAGAGIFSTFGFSVLKGLLKQRGIELGESQSQPPGPPEGRAGEGDF